MVELLQLASVSGSSSTPLGRCFVFAVVLTLGARCTGRRGREARQNRASSSWGWGSESVALRTSKTAKVKRYINGLRALEKASLWSASAAGKKAESLPVCKVKLFCATLSMQSTLDNANISWMYYNSSSALCNVC